MPDPVSTIRHDYRARKMSGIRLPSSIKWIVIHDMEFDDALKAAEQVGGYFASASARGSAHYGVDNDSTQQYLPDVIIPWGAPGANRAGLHIELAGVASHTRQRWLTEHDPMQDRAAWLIAAKAKQYNIPVRMLTPAEVRAGCRGIVTHATITAALPGGSHTDPGKGFPVDMLLLLTQRYFRPPGVRVGTVYGKQQLWQYSTLGGKKKGTAFAEVRILAEGPTWYYVRRGPEGIFGVEGYISKTFVKETTRA